MGVARPACAFILLSIAVLVAGCGGKSQPAPVSLAFKGSDLRFLLASQDGLSVMTVGGGQTFIARWGPQTYPLDPQMSPDRKTVAFALQIPAARLPSGDVDFGSDLYTVGADGKDLRLRLKHQGVAEFVRTPSWLSDHELLYTVRGRGAGGKADFRIEKLDLSGGTPVRFIDGGVDAALSKDGRKVVWDQVDPESQAETLTVAGIDLRNRVSLVTPASRLSLFSSQVFSPDGTKIAFAAVDISQITGGRLPGIGGRLSFRHPFAQDVWIVNVDGTGLRRLAEIAENMPSLTWSGDGSALYALGAQALWKIDPVSGKTEQLAPGVSLGQLVWLSGP
jgi:Tol biopolymer transport system component